MNKKSTSFLLAFCTVASLCKGDLPIACPERRQYHVNLMDNVVSADQTIIEQTATNAVLNKMLQPLMVRVRVEPDTNRILARPQAISSQEDFFRARYGWTQDELRGAFDWYLGHLQSTANSHCGQSENPLALAAIAQCRAMDYTNAVPLLKNHILGSFDPSREYAIAAIINWCWLDGDSSCFLENVFTNHVHYTMKERNKAYRCMASKILEFQPSSQAESNSVTAHVMTFYRNREDPAGAVTIDNILSRKLQGYEISSNRFETACSVLLSTNLWSGARTYLINVTNALMNANEPLVWVDGL